MPQSKGLSEEEIAACWQYADEHPECTVGDVVINVFAESVNVLDKAMLTISVIRCLLKRSRKGDV